MVYVDNGQRTHQIMHCRKCKFQTVIAPGTKGKTGTHKNPNTGRVCPFCGSRDVYYVQESNR